MPNYEYDIPGWESDAGMRRATGEFPKGGEVKVEDENDVRLKNVKPGVVFRIKGKTESPTLIRTDQEWTAPNGGPDAGSSWVSCVDLNNGHLVDCPPNCPVEIAPNATMHVGPFSS